LEVPVTGQAPSLKMQAGIYGQSAESQVIVYERIALKNVAVSLIDFVQSSREDVVGPAEILYIVDVLEGCSKRQEIVPGDAFA
jgi:hypothetical protein